MRRSIRLFVALDLPEAVLAEVARWQRSQAEGQDLRAVVPAALHVTLVFIGERPGGAVAPIASALEEFDPGPIEGRLLPEPVPLPRRRPRLLALAIESPGATALQAELSLRLRDLDLHDPDQRPYWPHLTVFRLRGRPGSRSRTRVSPYAGGDGHAFGFRRIALYRSDLRPEGASYSLLAANELPQRDGQKR